MKCSSYIGGQSLRLMGRGVGARALPRLTGTVNMKLWYYGLWLLVHGWTLNGLVTVFRWLTIGIDWSVASPVSPKNLEDYLLIHPQHCLSTQFNPESRGINSYKCVKYSPLPHTLQGIEHMININNESSLKGVVPYNASWRTV